MYLSDAAITHPQQDKFNRSRFARFVASTVLNFDTSVSSFCMALNGEWGVGKTSIINLIIYYIEMEGYFKSNSYRFAKDEAHYQKVQEKYHVHISGKIEEIERCNKSALMSSHKFIEKLFSDALNSQIDVEDCIAYWRWKEKDKLDPSVCIVRFSPWMFQNKENLTLLLLIEISRSVGHRLGDEVWRAFNEYAKRFAEYAPVAGSGIDAIGGIGVFGAASSASSLLISKSAKELEGPTIDELKIELSLVLKKLENKKILIIFDDLDRLLPAEAMATISIIKSLGDLPNIVYLLLYDESKFTNLLSMNFPGESFSSVTGKEYLDKIVQYKKTLPQIGEIEIFNFFIDRIMSLTRDSNISFDIGAFSIVWNLIISRYVKTPRHANNLANMYASSVREIHNNVDLLDFLVLETLQMFDNVAYKFIRINYGKLIGGQYD